MSRKSGVLRYEVQTKTEGQWQAHEPRRNSYEEAVAEKINLQKTHATEDTRIVVWQVMSTK